MREQFVSVEEAAILLGITPRAVLYRLRAGTMQGEKLGAKVWAIPRTEVARLQGQRLKPGPKPGSKRQRGGESD
jgi:hypothetical protein